MTTVARAPTEPATDQEYRRQVGKRVRLTRVDLDLSQDDIARKAGVTRNFVSAIERGTQGLDAWRLRLIAEALGVSLGWLLGVTDYEITAPPRPDRWDG